jgi:hypothetical protein
VVEGGVGEGTVFRLTMSVWGNKTNMLITVSEPEPGRVLKEDDPAAGVSTTFTIDPVAGEHGEGDASKVTIATTWRAKPGFTGMMERWINPAVARGLYQRELELLAAKVEPRG